MKCSAYLKGLSGEDREAGCQYCWHPACLGKWDYPPAEWLHRDCADRVGLFRGGIQGVNLSAYEALNTPCYGSVGLAEIENAFPFDGSKGKRANQESVVMKRFIAKNLSIPGESGTGGIYTRPSAYYVMERTERELSLAPVLKHKDIIRKIDNAWSDWKHISEHMLETPKFKPGTGRAVLVEDIVQLVEDYKKTADEVAKRMKAAVGDPSSLSTSDEAVVATAAEKPKSASRAKRQIVESSEEEKEAAAEEEDKNSATESEESSNDDDEDNPKNVVSFIVSRS